MKPKFDKVECVPDWAACYFLYNDESGVCESDLRDADDWRDRVREEFGYELVGPVEGTSGWCALPAFGNACLCSDWTVRVWPPDRVAFRKKGGEVIAFLPDAPARPGMVMSYQHVGQHSEASWDFYSSTKPCSEAEYAPLLEELKDRGYARLRVVKRIARKDKP